MEVFADTSGLSSGFAKAQRDLTTFGGRMTAAGAGFSKVGSSLTRYVSVPLAAAGGVAIKMAADFETAMQRTSSLAGIAGKDIAGFREEILALSAQTGQAPVDLANSLFLIGSAGLKANQVLPVLTASAEAASAQFTDAATAGDLLTGVMVAYGKNAPTAAQTMDALTQAIREGKAEPADLAANLGTVVPVAAEAGVQFDELAGAIAAMTNVNIGAARGATGLRYMLIQLQNPTEEAKSKLEDFGLTARQVQGWIEKDLVGGLRKLTEVFDLSTAKGKEAFFTTIGGVRSGQAALALVGESARRTEQILDSVGKAFTDNQDQFRTAVEEMQATPGVAMQIAFNKLRLAAIAAGDVLLPIGLEIVNTIGDIAASFARLTPAGAELAVKLGLIGIALGPVLKVLGSFQTVIGGVANKWAAASAGIAASNAQQALAAEQAAVATQAAAVQEAEAVQAAAAAEARAAAERQAAMARVVAAKQAEAAAYLQASAAEQAAMWETMAVSRQVASFTPPPMAAMPGGGTATPIAKVAGTSTFAPTSPVPVWTPSTGPSAQIGDVAARNAAALDDMALAESRAASQAGVLAGSSTAAASSLTKVGTASTGVFGRLGMMAAGFGKTALAMAEFPLILGGIAVAGGTATRIWDDMSTSNEDLAVTTGMTLTQIEALKTQLENGAAGLNLFGSKTDKVTEAGERYNAVFKDALALGYSRQDTISILAGEFADATEKIGGTTGSLETFEQQLRSGFGKMNVEAPGLEELRKSLDSIGPVSIEAEFIPEGGDWVSQIDAALQGADILIEARPVIDQSEIDALAAMAPTTIETRTELAPMGGTEQIQVAHTDPQPFIDLANAINGAIADGVALDDIMRELSARAREGAVSWEVFNKVAQAVGYSLPTKDLGKWGDLIYQATGGTDAMRREMASLTRGGIRFGVSISEAAARTIEFDLANGNLRQAVRTMRREMAGPTAAALRRHVDDLSAAEQKTIAAAIKAGDYGEALRLLKRDINDVAVGKKEVKVDAKITNKEQWDNFAATAKNMQREGAIDMIVKAQVQGGKGGGLEGIKRDLGDLTKGTHEVAIDAKTSAADRAADAMVARIENMNPGVTVGVTAPALSGIITSITNVPDGHSTIWVTQKQVPHEGGLIMHAGGRVPGANERDVRMMVGEHVTNVRSTQKWLDTLTAINRDDTEAVLDSIAGRFGSRELKAPPAKMDVMESLTRQVTLQADTEPLDAALGKYKRMDLMVPVGPSGAPGGRPGGTGGSEDAAALEKALRDSGLLEIVATETTPAEAEGLLQKMLSQLERTGEVNYRLLKDVARDATTPKEARDAIFAVRQQFRANKGRTPLPEEFQDLRSALAEATTWKEASDQMHDVVREWRETGELDLAGVRKDLKREGTLNRRQMRELLTGLRRGLKGDKGAGTLPGPRGGRPTGPVKTGLVRHSGGIIPGTGERMVKALAGEHLTNVRSTRRWMDTLQAINRDDSKAVLRSIARRTAGAGTAGGPTVVNGGNIQINLTVNGSNGDPGEVARAVGREVSRRVGAEMGGFALGG